MVDRDYPSAYLPRIWTHMQHVKDSDSSMMERVEFSAHAASRQSLPIASVIVLVGHCATL